MQVRLIHKMPSSVVCLVETVILPSKNLPFYAKNFDRRVTETRMPLVLFYVPDPPCLRLPDQLSKSFQFSKNF
jgi:hypothetical protein